MKTILKYRTFSEEDEQLILCPDEALSNGGKSRPPDGGGAGLGGGYQDGEAADENPTGGGGYMPDEPPVGGGSFKDQPIYPDDIPTPIGYPQEPLENEHMSWPMEDNGAVEDLLHEHPGHEGDSGDE